MNRIAIAVALAASVALTACSDDAQIASQNLSKAADNFEVSRRIIFYNGITDTYMLTIEGLCSISVGERKLDVTCKTGPGQYKKHFLGLSDNVTFFAEQLEGKSVSAYHYRVTFKPQSIIPDVNFRGDGKELTANQ
ncbi:hypothetical protein EN837_08175 [bacterium M00.F.Ca.ET.194.01.1.1]|nr:hypothetical protein EN837_08175 [bacterium M00.F.Ca.ET.194.01.1.1]TGS56238.1 hypothetical protein EN822_08175 [bacterium M00.F.Ca.ET.179.01.1.1]TGV49143.1 hypothetical protein EN811_08175 [bacterium M00.F.Ca.ET.168.01.1.1]